MELTVKPGNTIGLYDVTTNDYLGYFRVEDTSDHSNLVGANADIKVPGFVSTPAKGKKICKATSKRT